MPKPTCLVGPRPEHAEVVAGSDVMEPVLQSWGQQHGVTKLSTNAADIINDPDLDIIDVCTPNMYHAELAIAALNAGKHVICEKPLSRHTGRHSPDDRRP
ncbi:MAG: Gfo/Idh/MocA family oxidoreductase [Caldilineaceae bacterium]